MDSIVGFIKKNIKIIDAIVFVILGVIAAVAMFILFYRQSMANPADYLWPSDIKPYIEEMLGTQTKYNFPYPILFKTAYIFYLVTKKPELSMAIAILLFNVIAMIITKIWLTKSTKTYFLSTGTTFCLFFVSMIYSKSFIPLGIEHYYFGVCSPNPWHNATYMAARPFMILAFIFGAMTITSYEKDFSKDNPGNKAVLKYICFSVSLLLATLTKPSYTLVHLFACAFIMLYRFVATRFKNFRQSVIMALTFIPTLIAMLYQYASVFSGTSSAGEEQGMGIGFFKVWANMVANVPLAIFLAGAFPLLVLVFNWKQIKTDYIYRFSWQIYLAGFLSAALLYERGFREEHGNFFWGYICGLCIVFLSSIYLMLIETKKEIGLKAGLTARRVILAAEWGFLATHTLLGLRYFQLLCYGGNYI